METRRFKKLKEEKDFKIGRQRVYDFLSQKMKDGATIEESLHAVSGIAAHRDAHILFLEINKEIESGKSVVEAFARKVPFFEFSMVYIGMKGGILGMLFERMSFDSGHVSNVIPLDDYEYFLAAYMATFRSLDMSVEESIECIREMYEPYDEKFEDIFSNIKRDLTEKSMSLAKSISNRTRYFSPDFIAEMNTFNHFDYPSSYFDVLKERMEKEYKSLVN